MQLDKVLARRLELAEELAGVAIARAHRARIANSRAEVLAIAGGSAIFTEPGNPISQSIGCGVASPVTRAEIEQIERFYFTRGSVSQIVVSRRFAQDFERALAERGYALAERNLAFYCELPRQPRLRLPEGYEILEVPEQHRSRWAEMQSSVFFEDARQAAAFAPTFRLHAQAEGYKSYVAVDVASGEFAAGAAMFVSPQQGLACIAGAGTCPAHRGRGLQAALLERRLAEASASGCELAFVSVLPETTSCRNAERAGFVRAYERGVMVKAPLAILPHRA
jgi:GNAT superfamily N-acetyltransferase